MEEMDVNYETIGLNGLISDPNLGVRWKNGAVDRRVRGDGVIKKYDLPIPDRISVATGELFQFIERYLPMLDNVSDLMIKNTMIINSVVDGDIAYYSTVLREVMDIDCGDVRKEEYEFFLFRIRLWFMKHGITVLNSLSTPAVYSKFTGVKENTIRKWIERGKLDTYSICGVKFILVKEDEVLLWNAFLVEEFMRRDIDTVDVKNRDEIAGLYQKMYDAEDIAPVDSVSWWTELEEIYPSEFEFSVKGRYQISNAYQKYCDSIEGDPVTLGIFSRRLTGLGFKKYNSRKRGFYFWRKMA